MAKNRSNAANSSNGTVVVRHDHAWEFCCGTFWTTTCHEMKEGEDMATWTGHLDGPSEASFPGGQSFPAGARTIRCGKCNEPLLGLQWIRAAEHMIGDLIGDPGFKVWPIQQDRFAADATESAQTEKTCERCGETVAETGSDYRFSFDIWRVNGTRTYTAGSLIRNEVGEPVFITDSGRLGYLCESCEHVVSVDLIELAKKHGLNAIEGGRVVSRSMRDKKANP